MTTTMTRNSEVQTLDAPRQDRETDQRIAQQETGTDDPKQLAELPSTETLEECPNILDAAANMLSWIDDETVVEAIGERLPIDGLSRRQVKHFLMLLDTFPFRIRTSRTAEDFRETAGRLILEDGSSCQRVADQPHDALRAMKSGGLLAYDDAGVLHVTDKGRALIGEPPRAAEVEPACQDQTSDSCLARIVRMRKTADDLANELEALAGKGMFRRPFAQRNPWASACNALSGAGDQLLALTDHLCGARATKEELDQVISELDTPQPV